MSLALFRQLRSIRQGKLAQAERELRARLDEATSARMRAEAAQAEHQAMLDGKRALEAQWRASRLDLRTFVQDDCLAQAAALARWDTRIEASHVALQQAMAQLQEAMVAIQAAREALARCRVELAKADKGVERQRELLNQRDEALEEDELDELGTLASRHGPAAQTTFQAQNPV
jgi:hypothetical protein